MSIAAHPHLVNYILKCVTAHSWEYLAKIISSHHSFIVKVSHSLVMNPKYVLGVY